LNATDTLYGSAQQIDQHALFERGVVHDEDFAAGFFEGSRHGSPGKMVDNLSLPVAYYAYLSNILIVFYACKTVVSSIKSRLFLNP
jgi:hypothetical protein